MEINKFKIALDIRLDFGLGDIFHGDFLQIHENKQTYGIGRISCKSMEYYREIAPLQLSIEIVYGRFA